MKEFKLNEVVEETPVQEKPVNEVSTQENAGSIGTAGTVENAGSAPVVNSALPAKIGVWSKIKGFLFQEIDLNKPIVLELTPKEEKVLGEVHNFLFQEVKFPELHDFLFQEIHLFGKKKNKEQL